MLLFDGRWLDSKLPKRFLIMMIEIVMVSVNSGCYGCWTWTIKMICSVFICVLRSTISEIMSPKEDALL